MMILSEKERTLLMACTILDSVFDPMSKSFVKPMHFMNGAFAVPHLQVGTSLFISQTETWSFVKDLLTSVIEASNFTMWSDAIHVSIRRTIKHYADWRLRVLNLFSGSFTKYSDEITTLCFDIDGLKPKRELRQDDKAARYAKAYSASAATVDSLREANLRRNLRFADGDEAREIRQELETLESAGKNPVLSK